MAARINGSISGLIAKLEQAGGRAVKAVNDQMAAESKVIYQEIWNRMPVEFGHLEDALKVASNRRKSWTVYVDDYVAGHGHALVGDYAAYLNENPDWKPGPLSQEKGSDVGSKFMERGLDAAVAGGSIDRCRQALVDALGDAAGGY